MSKVVTSSLALSCFPPTLYFCAWAESGLREPPGTSSFQALVQLSPQCF